MKVFADLLVKYGRQLTGASRIASSLTGSRAACSTSKFAGCRALPVEACHRGVRARRCRPPPCCSFACQTCSTIRNTTYRAAAARSLGRLGTVEAIEPLITASVPDGSPATSPTWHCSTSDHPRSSVSPNSCATRIRKSGRRPADPRPHRGRSRHHPRRRSPRRSCRLRPIGVGIGARPARRQRGTDRARRRARRSCPRCANGGGTSARSDRRASATEALIPIARMDLFEPARAAAQSLGRIDPEVVLRLAADHDAGPHLIEAADRVTL